MTEPRQSGRTTRQLEPLVKGALNSGETNLYVCSTAREFNGTLHLMASIAKVAGARDDDVHTYKSPSCRVLVGAGVVRLMARDDAELPGNLVGCRFDRIEQDHEATDVYGPLPDWVGAFIKPKEVTPPEELDDAPIDHEQLKRTREALDRLG